MEKCIIRFYTKDHLTCYDTHQSTKYERKVDIVQSAYDARDASDPNRIRDTTYDTKQSEKKISEKKKNMYFPIAIFSQLSELPSLFAKPFSTRASTCRIKERHVPNAIFH